MRHSTPILTANVYTKLELHDKRAAVALVDVAGGAAVLCAVLGRSGDISTADPALMRTTEKDNQGEKIGAEKNTTPGSLNASGGCTALGGEVGIRTRGRDNSLQRISNPPVSATHPPLRDVSGGLAPPFATAK